jgi:hypothetical protein
MDRGRVGEDRGSKETDGCPLTIWWGCLMTMESRRDVVIIRKILIKSSMK